jgi:hypothetical protein
MTRFMHIRVYLSVPVVHIGGHINTEQVIPHYIADREKIFETPMYPRTFQMLRQKIRGSISLGDLVRRDNGVKNR